MWKVFVVFDYGFLIMIGFIDQDDELIIKFGRFSESFQIGEKFEYISDENIGICLGIF